MDDPFQFGQVAAANALSDVWAMGGTPKIAMNLLTFPNCLPLEVVQNITRKNQRYIACVSKLDAMSPLKVLTRGYAMAQTEQGEVLRSVSQVDRGQRIRLSVSDGQLTATVMDIKEGKQ